MNNIQETLEERLKKVDAYTYMKELRTNFEAERKACVESNHRWLLELSGLYDKRNVLSNVGKYIELINKEIIKNDIIIEELTNIINQLPLINYH